MRHCTRSALRRAHSGDMPTPPSARGRSSQRSKSCRVSASEAAIARAVGALSVCGDKIRARGVRRVRTIATEACRAAENADAFDRSIDSRIVRLRRKLDTDTIVTIRGAGYRFDPPGE